MSAPVNREAAVFGEAQRLPPEAQADYLDKACGGDPALRQRVEELLRLEKGAGSFLQQPAPGAPGPAVPKGVAGEQVGDRIGRYKLLENLGEGGCGVVYVAEQTDPVLRRVALKVIKLGMDTKAVVARFEAERQALAMMDHPSIAKVFDAGSTNTGRPFFVMELVRGVKITDYCDQNRLSTKDRLDLFCQVCHAIQHAHQKGIIHRDIKPSNILVTLIDGAPVPKVIDFGVAKATAGRLTEATVYTQLHQLIGTPSYMSPEQAEMTSVDVDTRSDIYSLGVLLYELLTGRTPFDAKELLSVGLEAMRRTIRETEPLRPSTRLAALKQEELTTTAKRRSAEGPRLISLLKGDLDAVVMKCLEKDRARRYETANGLAVDIQRHLTNEPVVARPQSKLYRFQKLVRRNKLTFAAGSAVGLFLLIGFGLSSQLLVQERRALRAEQARTRLFRATEKARYTEQLARLEAERAIEKARMDDLARTRTLIRNNLAQQRESVGEENLDIAVSLHQLGDALSLHGESAEAAAHFREALALERKLLGNDHPRVVGTTCSLAMTLNGAGKKDEAEELFRQALAPYRPAPGREPLPESNILAFILHHLAKVLREKKAPLEARPLANEALNLYQRHPEWPGSADEKRCALSVMRNVLSDLHDVAGIQALERNFTGDAH